MIRNLSVILFFTLTKLIVRKCIHHNANLFSYLFNSDWHIKFSVEFVYTHHNRYIYIMIGQTNYMTIEKRIVK